MWRVDALLACATLFSAATARRSCTTAQLGLKQGREVHLQDQLIGPNISVWNFEMPPVCKRLVGAEVTACEAGDAPSVRLFSVSHAVMQRHGALAGNARVYITAYCHPADLDPADQELYSYSSRYADLLRPLHRQFPEYNDVEIARLLVVRPSRYPEPSLAQQHMQIEMKPGDKRLPLPSHVLSQSPHASYRLSDIGPTLQMSRRPDKNIAKKIEVTEPPSQEQNHIQEPTQSLIIVSDKNESVVPGQNISQTEKPVEQVHEVADNMYEGEDANDVLGSSRPAVQYMRPLKLAKAVAQWWATYMHLRATYSRTRASLEHAYATPRHHANLAQRPSDSLTRRFPLF